ncbi:uncharacterized protein LOC144732234 [Lampetra planeri]
MTNDRGSGGGGAGGGGAGGGGSAFAERQRRRPSIGRRNVASAKIDAASPTAPHTHTPTITYHHHHHHHLKAAAAAAAAGKPTKKQREPRPRRCPGSRWKDALEEEEAVVVVVEVVCQAAVRRGGRGGCGCAGIHSGSWCWKPRRRSSGGGRRGARRDKPGLEIGFEIGVIFKKQTRCGPKLKNDPIGIRESCGGGGGACDPESKPTSGLNIKEDDTKKRGKAIPTQSRREHRRRRAQDLGTSDSPSPSRVAWVARPATNTRTPHPPISTVGHVRCERRSPHTAQPTKSTHVASAATLGASKRLPEREDATHFNLHHPHHPQPLHPTP